MGVRASLSLCSLLAAVAASLWAQRQLRAADRGLAYVALAFVLAFVAGRLLRSSPAMPEAPAPALLPTHPRWLAVGVGALAFVLTLQRFETAPVLQIAGTAVSMCAWLAAYLPRQYALGREPISVRATKLGLLASSLLVGVHSLERIPGGMYGDEGSLGMEVVALLDGTQRVAPFGLGWGRLPALFSWLEAAGVALTNRDTGGLRVAAAIGGALAVVPWFSLLRRELGVVVAAMSTLFLCVSPAHQHLSRIALPESWIRVCAFGALAALYDALSAGQAVNYVMSGIALGCCFYMASKAVLLPPIMLGAALALVLARLPGSRVQWRGALLLVIAAMLAFLPQLASLRTEDAWRDVLIGHPGRWMETARPTSPLEHFEQVLRLLLDRLESSPFTPFEYGSRIVSQVEGALMVVGLGVCIARPRRPICAFLLGWLVAGLASLALDAMPNQVPHAILVSCLPAALAGLALHALQQAAVDLLQRPRMAAAITAACAAPLIVGNGAAYFGRGEGAAGWEFADIKALGQAMNEYRDSYHVALVTLPMSWDLNSTLRYLAPGFSAPTKFTELDPNKPWFDPEPARDVALLVMPSTGTLLDEIRKRYPNAPVESRHSAEGSLVLNVVRIPNAEVKQIEARFGAHASR